MRDQAFTPLSEPLDDLFPKPLAANLNSKLPQKAVPKHFSKFYDYNARYEHYLGEVGHDTSNYWPLKRRVQELMDSGAPCIGLTIQVRFRSSGFSSHL